MLCICTKYCFNIIGIKYIVPLFPPRRTKAVSTCQGISKETAIRVNEGLNAETNNAILSGQHEVAAEREKLSRDFDEVVVIQDGSNWLFYRQKDLLAYVA